MGGTETAEFLIPRTRQLRESEAAAANKAFVLALPWLSTSLASFSQALRVAGGTHSFPSLQASHTRARTHTHPLPFLARPLVPVNLDYYLESEGVDPPKTQYFGATVS